MRTLSTDRFWDEAVTLEGNAQVLSVKSTRDAVLCLRYYWALADGKAKRLALAACDDVISRDNLPDRAKAAFIEAAKEAGYRVNSWMPV
ncbi:DUF982 domain-containing protein [Sinorhizobium sp. BG8]|uniref:DUF982 domain-containing protein n=1 Tax=Sinorhizobium sp. BG8 TaxID=2613773 RepID=UPI00193C9508|nr:DUF982 domain-containing protein [Sinorhizobium sp. BG8]QRM57387.1 DUF982 domain-containing protein [Sinorhizobium sp. BG8]